MRLEDVPESDLKALLEENLRVSQAIYASTEKTRKYILWGQILGVVKIIIVVVPIIWAAWYLKPYLTQALGTYQDLLNTSSSLTPTTQNVSDWQKLLKNLPTAPKQ